MALTYSTNVDNIGALTDRMQKGARIAVVEVTVGTWSADYSSGLTLAASKFGFNKVYNVLNVALRASSATGSDIVHIYDQNTNKLRLFDLSTNVEVAGSDMAAGDIVNMVVLGY